MAALIGVYDADRKDGAIIAFAVVAGVRSFKGALVSVNSAPGLVAPATNAAGGVSVAVLVRVQTPRLVRLRHFR